jgi:hypothetical protein
MKKPLKSFDAPLQMKEPGQNGRLNGSLRTQRPGSTLGRWNEFSPQYVFQTVGASGPLFKGGAEQRLKMA